MNPRLSFDVSPDARRALQTLESYIAECGLSRGLVALVKLRVSMMNGCAFCVDMHWRALRRSGESEARLFGLNAWREQAGYSDAERAALAWAESVTELSTAHVPDSAFQEISSHFSPKEVADLTYVVALINAWNRLCAAFRTPPAGEHST
jgi:AhpD family alkylhydroperoxidase